jgi:hypothetical protein
MAVMGSNIVRVEICSDVDDSNSVIEPCVLPATEISLYRELNSVRR